MNVGVDIKPDPVTIKVNDIVCWIFRSPRQYDVVRVDSLDQVVGNDIQEITVLPRYVTMVTSFTSCIFSLTDMKHTLLCQVESMEIFNLVNTMWHFYWFSFIGKCSKVIIMISLSFPHRL